MKRTTLIFIFLIFLLSQNAAQSQDKHFLWRVEGLSNTVYLLGSIHVAKEDFYPLPSVIEEAFEISPHLVVEVNVEKETLTIQGAVLLKGMYGFKDNLSNHIPEDLYEELALKAPNYQMTIEVLSKFKPWLVALMLTSQKIRNQGYAGDTGMEYYFLRRAKNKNILELETALFQVDMLANLPLKHQIENLREVLKDNKESEKLVDQIVALWKKGDTAAMEKIVFKDYNNETKIFYKRLYFDRNKNMVKKIENYLKGDGDYFVMAGAGHFIGKRGIINILKKKGYKITQL